MSELTKTLRRLMLEGRDWSSREEEALLDAHERLESAIAGTGDTAILTVNILRWPAEERIAFARHLLGSEWKSPEHERLEAEVERLEDVVLQKNAARDVSEVKATERLAAEIKALCNAVEGGLTAELAALKAEHARVCNDFALLVQESGREGRELDRLEGLLRAWWTARGDDESEASKELWEEAARLARAAS